MMSQVAIVVMAVVVMTGMTVMTTMTIMVMVVIFLLQLLVKGWRWTGGDERYGECDYGSDDGVENRQVNGVVGGGSVAGGGTTAMVVNIVGGGWRWRLVMKETVNVIMVVMTPLKMGRLMELVVVSGSLVVVVAMVVTVVAVRVLEVSTSCITQ